MFLKVFSELNEASGFTLCILSSCFSCCCLCFVTPEELSIYSSHQCHLKQRRWKCTWLGSSRQGIIFTGFFPIAFPITLSILPIIWSLWHTLVIRKSTSWRDKINTVAVPLVFIYLYIMILFHHNLSLPKVLQYMNSLHYNLSNTLPF